MNLLLSMLPSLATVILIIFLGVLVLLRNKKSLINVSFFLITLTVSGWLITNYLVDKVSNPEAAVYLIRLTNIFGAWAVFSLLFFAVFFPSLKNKKSIFYLEIYSIYPIIFTLLLPTNLFLVDVIRRDWGYDSVRGILALPHLIYLGLTLLISLSVLVRKMVQSKGQQKVQVKFIFLGLGLSGVISLALSVFIPILIQSSETAKYTPFATLFFIGFTSYVIVKHKFLDIRMVVARSVAYLVLLLILAAFYVSSVLGLERLFFSTEISDYSIAQIVLRTVISVAMVFLFQPLKKWITNATDKIFFKNQYNIEELLSQLSHTVSSTIVLIEMLYKVNDLLITNMKLSRSAFVIFKNKDEAYTSQALGYKGWPPIDVPDFIKLANKGILIYDELEENSIYKKLLRKYDAAVLVPIKAENEIIGVFLGGEKNSGDMFNQQDLQVFEIMGPEVAIGVQNAKAYEEISKFNVTLRQEIKRATQRLKDKNEELKELDKAKDEFISMASHQLRTPLTAIKGYLSMLLEGDAGEIKVSQYDFINEAYSAAGRMVGLINDLLNVSRMETGRFFLEPKDCDIERIVGEEVKQLQNHAREKGIYLKIEAKGKVPHISADETKIRQVVMNFIDNAIYYTQKGGVTVKMTKDKSNFYFQVFDTGIGVPKVQRDHLFEKFFRADNARQTRPDGTGLGIYLAKRVVEDHGGKVLFDSEEGKGSMFGFKFPLKTKTTSKMSSAPAPGHSAPALTSAAATFDSKEVGIEPPIATHPE